MRCMSVWKLWNRRARRGEPAEDGEALLSAALHNLRVESAPLPRWEAIERVILTQQKEQIVKQASSSRARLVFAGVASATVLLVFFVVPFSQTTPLGAKITFVFEPPQANSSLPAQLDDVLAGALSDTSYGIINVNVNAKGAPDGLSQLEVLVLTENGLVPDDLANALTSRIPELAQARMTVNPITERSTATLCENVFGGAQVKIECEGSTPEEIEAQVKASLAAQGKPNAEVKVECVEGGGMKKVKIEIRDTTAVQ